jgi:hypothetical protein
MLVLLGLAAIAGVGTIFLNNGEFVARVAGTLVVAAVAIGLAIPVSRRLEQQETRSSGLFALTAIVVGFCLGLTSIWMGFLGGGAEEEIFLTTLAYVACAIPAVVFVSMARSAVARLAGSVGLVLAVVTFALWLIAIWGRRFGLGANELASTAGIVGGVGVPICACLVGRVGDRRGWRWIGVVAGAVAIALGLHGVWVRPSDDSTWFMQALIVAGAVAAMNLLLRAPLRGVHRWVVFATAAALVATALSATAANVTTNGFRNPHVADLSLRLLGAGAIVTACGILAIVVIAAFNRRALITQSARIDEIRERSLTCPRCGRKQRATFGESPCAGCGLIFLIRVAEPRCPKCDYSLLGVQAKVCPECGEPVHGARSPIAAEAGRHADTGRS